MAKCLYCERIFTPGPESKGMYCSRECSRRSPKKRIDPVARFWSRVNKTDTCWIWTGALGPGRSGGPGYGTIVLPTGGAPGKKVIVHRFSWELHFGPIPDGIFVCHKCDNPPCVNPAHLFLGTLADNQRDMAIKGRVKSPKLRGEASGASRLTSEEVRLIRAARSAGSALIDLARQYSVCKSTIHAVVQRKTWAHI